MFRRYFYHPPQLSLLLLLLAQQQRHSVRHQSEISSSPSPSQSQQQPTRRVRVVVRKQMDTTAAATTTSEFNETIEHKTSSTSQHSATASTETLHNEKFNFNNNSDDEIHDQVNAKKNLSCSTHNVNVLNKISATDLTQMSDQNLDKIWAQFSSTSKNVDIPDEDGDAARVETDYHSQDEHPEGYYSSSNTRNANNNTQIRKTKQHLTLLKISSEVSKLNREIVESNNNNNLLHHQQQEPMPSDIVFQGVRKQAKMENSQFGQQQQQSLPPIRVVKKHQHTLISKSKQVELLLTQQPQPIPPRISPSLTRVSETVFEQKQKRAFPTSSLLWEENTSKNRAGNKNSVKPRVIDQKTLSQLSQISQQQSQQQKQPIRKKDAIDALLEKIVMQQQHQQTETNGNNKKNNDNSNAHPNNNEQDDGWSVIPPFQQENSSSLNRTTVVDEMGHDFTFSPSSSTIPLDFTQRRNFSSVSHLLLQKNFSQQMFKRIDNIQKSSSKFQQQQFGNQRNNSSKILGGKQRTEEWYLGSILDKIFAELNTDGKRLPVSKCISYLFDNSNNSSNNSISFQQPQQRLAAIAFANPSQLSPEQEQQLLKHQQEQENASNTITSSSSSGFASFTTRQLSEFFDPSKPLSFVPASVKKEVRSRFQQRGGLLKFIEQFQSNRYAITKDPVTSELAITVCSFDAFSQNNNNNNENNSENGNDGIRNSDDNDVRTAMGRRNDSTLMGNDDPSASSSSSHPVVLPWSTSSAASPVNKPWNNSLQRMQVDLSWTERVPIDATQADTYLDMMAAGCRPIYGEEWTYQGNLVVATNTANNNARSGQQDYYLDFDNDGSNFRNRGNNNNNSDNMPIQQQRVLRTAEVADIFVEFIPTFWVLEKHLARALAERFQDVLEESGFALMEDFFDRYPKIFEVYFEGDPRAREVRLNPDFNRKHPRRGLSDKLWELRASSRAEDEILKSHDRLFGKILLENLAKCSASDQGLFVFLPEWIRKSFSQQDRATINSAPPQRTLFILNKYANLFQIRSHEIDGAPPVIQQKRFLDQEEDYSRYYDDGTGSNNIEQKELSEQQQQQQPRQGEGSQENETDPSNKHQSEAQESESSNHNTISLSEEYSHIPNEFRLWVRRRPVHLAPRCLDEFDTATSPAPVLAEFLLESVTDMERELRQQKENTPNMPTSSMPSSPSNVDGDDYDNNAKYEINIQNLYTKLLSSSEHRKMLKPFGSLAKFLRLHGQIFCVSSDLLRVALHRWDGASHAFATIDSLLAEEDTSSSFLPDNHLAFRPRTRKQLTHVDPSNPLLNRAYLQQAIHDVLPEHSAVVVTHLFRKLMPREASAALSTRNPYSILMATPLLTLWKAHNNYDGGKRCLMVQRAELGPPPKGCGLEDCATKEEIITQIQDLLGTMGPMSIRILHEKLRWDAIVGIKEHFKSIDVCLRTYPQLFVVEMPEEIFGRDGDVKSGLSGNGILSCVVGLKKKKGI